MDEAELLALLHGIREAPIRVCRMNSYFPGKIGAHTNVVLLSRDTVSHMEAKHRQRDLKLYRLAETIINYGTLYEVEARKVIAVWHAPPDEGGKVEIYKAVLKATKNGREIF